MTIDQSAAFSVDELHHEVLMQLEAIIFASEAPVSLLRLKEAFQNQYNKQQLRQFYSSWLFYNMAVQLSWSKVLRAFVFRFVPDTNRLLPRLGRSGQPGFPHLCSKQ